MKSNIALVALASCVLPFAAKATQIININALCPDGSSVKLSAGTYEVDVIGTSQGGEYNGWDFSTSNHGSSTAASKATDWVDSFDIKANGVETKYLPSGNPGSSSAASALSLYQSSILDANGVTATSTRPGTVVFTVNSAQTVTFTVADCQVSGESGGTSLRLTSIDPPTATPEPSSFALMGLGLAGSIAAFRRKWNR